jgi:N-acetylmuramoyl-L-alanine amidase
MKILLIAGHGAGDPGAIGNGYREANLVREMLPPLSKKLSAYAEVTVFDTSKNPYEYFKTHSFNFKNYDYVLELHFNAFKKEEISDGKSKGIEILVHPLENGVGVENAILNNIVALGFTNRGIKRRSNLQNMNICKGKQGVSYALIETCFIDDIDDMLLYQSKKEDVINGIANGIIEGFDLAKIEQNAKTDLTTIEGIIKELADRKIITDVELWQEKLKTDRNAYWLAFKCADYIIRSKV